MKVTKSREIDAAAQRAARGLRRRGRFADARPVVCVLALAGLAFGCRWIWIRVRRARCGPRRLSVDRQRHRDHRSALVDSQRRTDRSAPRLGAGEPAAFDSRRRAGRADSPGVFAASVGAKVVRVTKSHPAGRRGRSRLSPPGGDGRAPGGIGLYPVHIEGVVLPQRRFLADGNRAYPWLSGIESSPLGPTGTKWGDPVVAGGSRIAAALQPRCGELGLRSIHWLKPTAEADSALPHFTAWSRPPATPLPGARPPAASCQASRRRSRKSPGSRVTSPATAHSTNRQAAPELSTCGKPTPPRGRPRDPNSGGVHLLAEFARIP